MRDIQCRVCSQLHQMFIAVPEIAKLVHFQVITCTSLKGFGDGFKMTSARLFEFASRLDNKRLGISTASRPAHSPFLFPLFLMRGAWLLLFKQSHEF